MKFAIVALIATAAAADPVPTAIANASDWSVCKSGADCKGKFYCCGVTKKADGSDASKGSSICVSIDGRGTVPSTAKTPYVGFSYFCTKAAHIDPTNSKDIPAAYPATNPDGSPKEAGAATLVVSATSAAVAAFLLT